MDKGIFICNSDAAWGWQESNEKELVKVCSFKVFFSDVNSITALHSLMAFACVEVRVAAGQKLICQKKSRTAKTSHLGVGMEDVFGRAHLADFSDEGSIQTWERVT